MSHRFWIRWVVITQFFTGKSQQFYPLASGGKRVTTFPTSAPGRSTNFPSSFFAWIEIIRSIYKLHISKLPMLLKIHEARGKGATSRKFKISYKQYDYNLKGKKNPIKIREETLDNVSVIVTRYKSNFNSSFKYKVIIWGNTHRWFRLLVTFLLRAALDLWQVFLSNLECWLVAEKLVVASDINTRISWCQQRLKLAVACLQ